VIKTFFDGRVGADAELKFTPTGKAVATFSVAVDQGKDREGEKRAPMWVKCTLWEKRAEALAPHIKKGIVVVICGRPSTEAWKDKRTDDAQAKLCITVDEFSFGGGSASSGESEGESRPQPQYRRDDIRSTEITDEDIPF